MLYQVIFLTYENQNFMECASIPTLILEIIFPIYAVFVLYFVFKYCNIIINEFRGLARFGLMHSIGTALSFWIFTIVRETSDAIYLKQHKKDKFDTENDSDEDPPVEACPTAETLDTVFKSFSPYLYPFVIEFCILMAGIFYMMWANINKCPNHNNTCNNTNDEMILDDEFIDFHDLVPTYHNNGMLSISELSRVQSTHETLNQQGNVIHIDCQSSNRGVFGALLLNVATIVAIIVLFITVSET